MLAVSSLFFFLSTAFFLFFVHFTIHSCEWSCSLPFTICIDDHGSFVSVYQHAAVRSSICKLPLLRRCSFLRRLAQGANESFSSSARPFSLNSFFFQR